MYKINDLPYDYDALEPFIDTHTLGLHYNKHQKNYLKKLNELLLKNNYNFKYSIEELPKYVSMFNDDDIEDILEEVIYTICLSINDNYNVKEVVFNVDNKEIYKTVLKSIE